MCGYIASQSVLVTPTALPFAALKQNNLVNLCFFAPFPYIASAHFGMPSTNMLLLSIRLIIGLESIEIF